MKKYPLWVLSAVEDGWEMRDGGWEESELRDFGSYQT